MISSKSQLYSKRLRLYKKSNRGFTLIELTVALALFAIATVIISQSFLGGMLSLEAFKYNNPEEDALRNVYNQILTLENRSDLQNGGTIKTPNLGTAKWTAEITFTPTLELYKVNIHVSFDTSPKTFQETFYTHTLNWAERGERSEFLSTHKDNKKSSEK